MSLPQSWVEYKPLSRHLVYKTSIERHTKSPHPRHFRMIFDYQLKLSYPGAKTAPSDFNDSSS